MTAVPPDRQPQRPDHRASRRTAAIPTLAVVAAIVVIVALILLL